jgi:hypothetical protein
MKLTNTQKKLLDKKTISLIEAGFLTTDLKITDDCRYYMEHLDFLEKFDKLVSRANEKIKEDKKVKEEVKEVEEDNED